MADPGTLPNGVRERTHLIEDPPNVWHDVLTIDEHAAITAVPKCGVKHRPSLGFIDRLTGEHPVDPCLDLALAGEIDEKPQGLLGDAVLRVVEE